MTGSIPTVTIVGRPNVGKSTLFNKLARKRKSIVIDEPNATRDWLESLCQQDGGAYRLIDTAGVFQPSGAEYSEGLRKRTEVLLAETDLVLFLVDAREGLHAIDGEIASWLRQRCGRIPAALVVNKSEGRTEEEAALDFHALGMDEMKCISALRGDNLKGLQLFITERLGLQPDDGPEADAQRPRQLVLVGRPNVGKSSLANALLGSPRVLVSERAGTTRDCVEAAFTSGNSRYILSDTAGLRRRSREGADIERKADSRTVDAVKRSDVVLWLLDATSPLSTQDKTILRLVLDVGKALVIVLNKWDLVDPRDRRKVRRTFTRELEAYTSAVVVTLSATGGSFRAGPLLAKADLAYADATRSFSTRQLMAALRQVVSRKAPPMSGKIRPRLRYAHQGGKNPLLIVVHGNALDSIGGDYKRYLIHAFARELGLASTAPRILLRLSANPYV